MTTTVLIYVLTIFFIVYGPCVCNKDILLLLLVVVVLVVLLL